MMPRARQFIFVASTSLFCGVSVQAQTFSTTIMGRVADCGPFKTYNDNGKPGKYTIEDNVSSNCSLGTAVAASGSSLNAFVDALANSQNAAGSESSADVIQTATLIPPKGFTGDKVQFSLADAFSISIENLGAAGSEASAEVCWGIAQLGFRECHPDETNGSFNGTVHTTLVVTKSTKGFQLTIEKRVNAKAVGSDAPPPPATPTVKVYASTIGVPILALPKGWGCKYDSGTKCVHN